MKNIIVLLVLSFALSGCSSLVKQTQVVPGMSKDQVTALWGSPQRVVNSNNSCCKAYDEESMYFYSTKYQPSSHPKYVLLKDNRVKYVFEWKG